MTNSNGAYTDLAFRTWRAWQWRVASFLLGSVSAEVTIPDTPAGRIMSAWLEAFRGDLNSEKRTQAHRGPVEGAKQ
jgi:hypothetical protein